MQTFITLSSIGLYIFVGVLIGTLVVRLGSFGYSEDKQMAAAMLGMFWPFGVFIIGGLWLGRRISSIVKK